jgi:hypothetical protein
LQRLNPKVPELSFVSLAARRRAFFSPCADK